MNFKDKRAGLMGVIGGLGVVAFLGSVPGGLYPPGFGVFLALATWIIGATLVNLFTR